MTTREFLYRHLEAGTGRSWIATDHGAVIGVVTMLILDLAPRPEDASGLEGYIVNEVESLERSFTDQHAGESDGGSERRPAD